MKSEIAEPYCNWIPDEGAKYAPVLLIRNIAGGLGISAIMAIPFIGLLMKSDTASAWFIVVLCPTFFVGVITCAIAQAKASTAQIRCSVCKQNMLHTQVNHPNKASKGFLAGAPLVEGADGRQYMQTSISGKSAATHWCRVFQELRICKSCKRYVVIKKIKTVPIGTTRRDVEQYEARLVRQRHALAGKTFRRKKG